MNQMPMCVLHHIAECIPPPPDYETLWAFILSIDAQYWNFKEMESNCKNKKALGSNHTSSGSSGSLSNKNSGNNSNNNSSGSNNNSKDSSGTKSNNNSNQINNSGKNNAGKKNKNSNTSENLSSKLGPDGKLTPEEKQCWIDKGLCLVCGQRGHMAKECPKAKNTSSSSTAKGRAAKVEPKDDSNKSSEASRSKK